MSLKHDKRRLLGPSDVQHVSLSNSSISETFIDIKNDKNVNSQEGEEEEDIMVVERDILQHTCNSSTLYTVTNKNEYLSLLSSMYVKPYKQQFVEKCVINVNFENFINKENLTTYEHFVQEFLESTIILSEYPKSGLDFFIKNVTTSNNYDITKKQPVDVILLKHLITSTILTLLEANISIKYWPAVGISKSKKTLAIYIKNESEIISYLSNTQSSPLINIKEELEECKIDARKNRFNIKSWF